MFFRQLFAAPLIASLALFTGAAALLQTSAELPPAADSLLPVPAISAIWCAAFVAVRRCRARHAPTSQSPPPMHPLAHRLPGILALSSMLLLAAADGYYYAGWRAAQRMADQLPTAWEGRDLLIRGVIDDLPASDERGARFSLTVEDVLTPDAVVPSRIALTWYARNLDGETETLPELRSGARWQLNVRLKRPHATLNPGAFDTEAWLLQHNVRATGYIRPDAGDDRANRLLDPFAARPLDYIQRLRENIRQRIERTLPDRPYAGVITALVIGEQRAIPGEQWQVFNRTGITHLVSISGLHVTIFSALVGGLLFWAFRRLPRLTSRYPAIRLAALAGFFASAFYVALAGAGIPAQRTLIMLAVVTFALWSQRLSQPLHTWLWALFIVVLWDPWAPLSAGFWLSFGAVGWLLYAASGRLTAAPQDSRFVSRTRRALLFGIRTQCVVTLGLTPLLLAIFQQCSLVSLPANFWAIPWITLLVIPVALLGAVPGLSALWHIAYALIDVLMNGLSWLAYLPLALWQQHGAPAWSIAAALLGVLWLLAPRGVPGRALGVLWCLPLFLVTPPAPPVNGFHVTVLDVGQGLAVFVRTARHTLLYDTGPSYRGNTDADAGNRVVLPFLQYSAVGALDALVVSHADNDHAGGEASILDALPVALRYFSADTEKNDSPSLPLRLHYRPLPPSLPCVEGRSWNWDGVAFRFLSPPAAEATLRSRNDRSCVLKIESPHGSLLLTGDIGTRGEKLLLQNERAALASTLLVAPHHGSKLSSSPPFIEAVAPETVIYSVGYRNRFDFPRPETVARYQAVGADQRRTDESGALTFRVSEQGIAAEAYRQTHPRYWR